MIFRELVLQNFGPYKGRQILNLSPEQDGVEYPIVLIGGMNGEGKTTLMDALRLVLYGSQAQCTTRGKLSYSDFLTQLVNRSTPPGEETQIELVFSAIYDNNPTEFRILRRWQKNPKNKRDTFEAYVDNWLNTKVIQEWGDLIEKWFPIGISNFFLFDGEQVKDLAEELDPSETIIAAIHNLLGLELVDKLYQDLEVVKSRRRRSLSNSREELALKAIEEKLLRYQKELADADQELKAQEKILVASKGQERIAFDRFISEGGKLAKDRHKLEKKAYEINENIDKVRDILEEQASGILPLTMIQELLKEALNQGKEELYRQQLKIAKEILIKRDQELLDFIGQAIPERLGKIQDFLKLKNQEFDRELDSYQAWLYAEEDTLMRLSQLLSEPLLAGISATQKQLSLLESQKEDLAHTEKGIAMAASPEAYKKLTDAVKEAEDLIDDASHAYETTKERYAELEKIISSINLELINYSEVITERNEEEYVLTTAIRIKETLQIFRERLQAQKLNSLEETIAKYFNHLLRKIHLISYIEIDAERYRLSLYDDRNELISKSSLSAGEKQILAIATLWGLATISGRTLPVVIDTPLGRLDSSHRKNLLERYFPKASYQVILLSTDVEIGAKEIEYFREQKSIAREYILIHNDGQTTVESGYFSFQESNSLRSDVIH